MKRGGQINIRAQVYAGLSAVIAIAVGVTIATAAGPKKVTGSIKGTIGGSNVTAGACAAVEDANGEDSYDTICANPSSCACLSASKLSLGGGFGKGTANIFVTVDDDASVKTGVGADACAPAFAVFTLVINPKGKIPGKTQTINAMGAVCGTAGVTPVAALGGFSVAGSSVATTGSGTFNGTVSQLGALAISLSGTVANP